MFNSKGVLSAELKEVLTMLQGESVMWTERRHSDCAEFSGTALYIRAITQWKADASMHQSSIVAMKRNRMTSNQLINQ